MKIVKRYLAICLICMLNSFSDIKAQEVSPVTELPLQLSVSHGTRQELIIYVTGDGGWNSFNQQIVQQLEQQGYGTVALNSRKYFWREKSPEIFAGDFEQLANYYLKTWGKSELIILGYSFGADVASFLPNRVSPELRKKIKKIALISPSASTDFVIRLSDLVSETENINRKYKVSPQIEQTDMTVVCTFGQEEIKVLRNGLTTKKNLTIISLPGDHRYQYNFSLLVKTILI